MFLSMTMRWQTWLITGMMVTLMGWPCEAVASEVLVSKVLASNLLASDFLASDLSSSSGSLDISAGGHIDLSQSIVESPISGKFYFVNQMLDDLAQADVVYLGETHHQLLDHQMQQVLIEGLYHRYLANAADSRPPGSFAIALEMFQRPFQPLLDQYIAGDISEADLREQSEFDIRWGFPWEYYAPILRFAQAHRIPLLALNAPAEITTQIARQGISSLSEEQLQWISPLSELDLSEPDYAQLLQRFYEEIHANHSNSSDFDQFFLIQTLWDESMADGIANFLKSQQRAQVLVLAGQGHIVYNFGIPNRVARRQIQMSESITQRTILLSPEVDGFALDTSVPLADYLWFAPLPE